MICSGDAGVYGMAGLMYEVGENYPDVELIPYEASSERMVELLLNGELDFAIINLTSDHPLFRIPLII